MKKLPIYYVQCTTTFGIGVQAVKARDEQHVREKFAKRFPKSSIIDAWEAEEGYSIIKTFAI